MGEFELASVVGRVRRKRLNKAPDPRFKPDLSAQLDVIGGCPELHVPKDDIARALRAELQLLDWSEIEKRYSSQGQHGYHPRHLVGALVYGSYVGVHESTKLARLLKNDAAARLLSGGHAISAGRLRAFRRENEALFTTALQKTVELAQQRGLVDTDQLAIDSVRLRAEASQKAVRKQDVSTRRLEELASIDAASLDGDARAKHDAKVTKHTEAVRLCKELNRPMVVTTSLGAAQMAFPNGLMAPGHRATVVAVGVQTRLIVDVLVDSSGNDFGKLGPAVLRAREKLAAAGVPLDRPMQIAGDSGYFSKEDLVFALQNGTWMDALIEDRGRPGKRSEKPRFAIEDFKRSENNTMTCPAGRRMRGPHGRGSKLRWEGVDCQSCGLKAQCTSATKRVVTLDTEWETARAAMLARMAQPGARARYHKRMATIEPVFSSIEDAMGFRRVSSRKEGAVRAEVLLKVLTYNLGRLIQAKRLRRVRFVIACDGQPSILPAA